MNRIEIKRIFFFVVYNLFSQTENILVQLGEEVCNEGYIFSSKYEK